MKTKVERLDSLSSDPNNARLHSPRNLKVIADSLARFGQRRPLVVRRTTRTVIAGNGMLQAMRDLAWTAADVLWVDDDDQTAAAYALVDNRAGELSAWDYDMLQATAADAGDALIGWTPEEMSWMDEAPAALAKHNSTLNQVGKTKPPKRAKLLAVFVRPEDLEAIHEACGAAMLRDQSGSASEALAMICRRYCGHAGQ